MFSMTANGTKSDTVYVNRIFISYISHKSIVYSPHRETADEAAAEAARPEPEYDEDGQIIEKPEGAVWKLPSNPNADQDIEIAPPPRGKYIS